MTVLRRMRFVDNRDVDVGEKTDGYGVFKF